MSAAAALPVHHGRPGVAPVRVSSPAQEVYAVPLLVRGNVPPTSPPPRHGPALLDWNGWKPARLPRLTHSPPHPGTLPPNALEADTGR